MKRRDFIALLGGAAITWPVTARGQQAGKVRRIGVFVPGSVQTHGQYVTAFRNKLNTLGYVEGTD
jgi:putative ABC transport system substrate-binding protein